MEFASSFLQSAASSLAAAAVTKSTLSSNYTDSPSSSSSAGSRTRSPVQIGVWKASSLSRLRHPCILEMAELMEETRSSITFATEPVTASLRHAIAASDAAHDASASASSASSAEYRSRPDQDLELDEVEVQKGLSQLGKGLQFLHESAKLVHGNLTPEAVIINAKGDWKLSGFGLSQPLFSPEGAPAKWEFPSHDPALPPSCQRSYDYIAPEYICDEMPPAPSNDMYSLGCILHAIHTHSGPPFSNRNSLANLRNNIDEGLSRNLVASQWRRLPQDVQEVLASLVTRYPNRRMTAKQFLDSRYFEGLLVSTLRFLERDSFAAKSSEAQAGFLKGLVTVLNQFSDKVNRRKVLPSLLEETRKANLVPFLLPNILHIAGKMSPDDFRLEVLPSLKPLFALKEPPQAVVALIESLPVFELKCAPAVFRDEIMPLVYYSLESDNPVVLEKALRVVPKLCETLDYTTVKQTLFPKITTVFSKTTLLSVKVNTLICFHAMINVLDKFTLTEKLVPLLARIKTKEPSVMIATLAVHEEMGKKCEVEAIATLILPQLWTMSIGPLLNADQFAKFMSVIKALGNRVEQEHMKHLAELKRLEESSGGGVTGGLSSGPANSGFGAIAASDVTDFETLVRGNVNGQRVDGLGARGNQVDIFADISPAPSPVPQHYANGHSASAFASPPLPSLPASASPFASTSSFTTPAAKPVRATPSSRLSSTPSLTPAPRGALGARPLASAAGGSSIAPPNTSTFSNAPSPTTSSLKSFAPLQPGLNSTASSSNRTVTSSSLAASSHQPNYNLSLSTTSNGLPPLQPTSSSLYGTPSYTVTPASTAPPQPIQWNRVPAVSSPSAAPPLQPQQQPARSPAAFPPGYNPSASLVPTTSARPNPAQASKGPMDFGAWADLDPLK
ncbi:hypothetical protein BMF94_1488 [Rhodotorula taiwanensis]|uniref:Protein kinase domain-containing protein n=1 Tax=Rhodotorula taiwanensis TaxID=741276 RepID=A0A2S5BF57_9BASI|nr:hypothetical protein BMF94_1488 [Rhodotorula taiwanensis]